MFTKKKVFQFQPSLNACSNMVVLLSECVRARGGVHVVISILHSVKELTLPVSVRPSHMSSRPRWIFGPIFTISKLNLNYTDRCSINISYYSKTRACYQCNLGYDLLMAEASHAFHVFSLRLERIKYEA